MKKEIYKAETPGRIQFGDPSYFNEFEGEKLEKLVVDYKPPRNFQTNIVLKELVEEGMTFQFLSIYLAPETTMKVYQQDMMYEHQSHEERHIGVDTAKYIICVGDREDCINTDGDGYWGDTVELFHYDKNKKVTDAMIINILMPEDIGFEKIRRTAEYFFPDMQLVIEKANKNKEQER